MRRAGWLGYRWRRHGLDGRAGPEAIEDLLLLGFQDSRGGGAARSLAERGRADLAATVGPDGPLVSLWSVRGAPHVHRVGRLDTVRDALAPQDSDDGGPGYVAAVAEVAAALAAVVTGPTPKGEASAAVTGRVAGSLVQRCRRCKADHVPDGLFRAAGRQAQVVLGAGEGRATVLHPPPRRRQDRTDRPRLALVEAYLRVNGPTTRTAVRDWMEAGTESTAAAWRQLDGVVPVQLDGRRAELPEAALDAVRTAPPAEGVALVPPHDPYLRQVDRTLLVPDRAQRSEVWKALSAPGAVLVDGEVAGTWRHREADRTVTVSPFRPLSRSERAAVAERAGDRAVAWS